MKALVGLNEERRGAVHFDGIDISQVPAEQVSRLGLIMVPEGRLLFDSLTIEENLLMGSVNRRKGSWTCGGCSTCSRSWKSGGGCFRVSSPAASSRWRRSVAR